MVHTKDFNNWNTEKQRIDASDASRKFFKEREIWWCKFGTNIGYEIDGKGDFRRPVLILKKLSRHTFIGIPLTTKKKGVVEEKGLGDYFFKIREMKDRETGESKESVLELRQLRFFDRKRLIDKMYQLPGNKFKAVKAKLIKLLS